MPVAQSMPVEKRDGFSKEKDAEPVAGVADPGMSGLGEAGYRAAWLRRLAAEQTRRDAASTDLD
jgi:hypothetical protein